MIPELVYRDTCDIYDPTRDEYGTPQFGAATQLPCLYVQTTAYQHGAGQDAITGTSRIVLPGQHPFVTGHSYRLEEMIVNVNPFGADASAQLFKIVNVTVARDVLLYDQVHHVECDLKKIEGSAYVS